MISVKDLTFDYPGRRVLDALSFDLPKASVTALVGVNGIGKTTLMRCLAGLQVPDRGDIRVGGQALAENPQGFKRGLGYLSDFFGLYDDLTVGQCLRHAAALHGRDLDLQDPAIAAMVEALCLSPQMNKKAGDLSRGQRQSLGIVQAMIHAPDVILLDEPASGLDPVARNALADLIRGLSAAGKTLIVSSHILAELEDYSTHMLHLQAADRMTLTAIGGAGVGDEARQIKVLLATADDRLVEVLNATTGVSDVRPTDRRDGATFALVGGNAGLAQLIRRLVEKDLPVVQVYDRSKELQATFLAQETTPKGEIQ